jgi:hypothetical protein
LKLNANTGCYDWQTQTEVPGRCRRGFFHALTCFPILTPHQRDSGCFKGRQMATDYLDSGLWMLGFVAESNKVATAAKFQICWANCRPRAWRRAYRISQLGCKPPFRASLSGCSASRITTPPPRQHHMSSIRRAAASAREVGSAVSTMQQIIQHSYKSV